jgi:hypothetical protein
VESDGLRLAVDGPDAEALMSDLLASSPATDDGPDAKEE